MDSEYRFKALRHIAADYQELNGTHYEQLETPPTALEFLRLVHISRPVVIKVQGIRIAALEKWTDKYLTQTMGPENFSVAVTPNGHADAIALGPDGIEYFVEPHVQHMTMQDLLKHLHDPETKDQMLYLQSQNGNLYRDTSLVSEQEGYSEFERLKCDVPHGISWATEAFGKLPDAVNLWIGDQRSVTSVHSGKIPRNHVFAVTEETMHTDPYENIYTVVRGTKHFTLFPPTEGWCLRERLYPHARYTRSDDNGPLHLTPSDPPNSVRWSSISDPTAGASLPPEAKPLSVTLEAGDTLYLPVGWWHYVRQSGLTIALNWWYDTEMQGMQWTWLSFLRKNPELDAEQGDDGESTNEA